MASKTTLNATNLEALGAAHLAQLLIEISTGNANAKRRLRLELAGVESPDKLVKEIRKRLTAIASATATVGWRSLKGFKADLQTQRRLIIEQVSKAMAPEALALMWSFIAMSHTVLERVTDTSGESLDIFKQASLDLVHIADIAQPSAEALLPHLTDAVLHNGYGQVDGLITGLVPHLGDAGLRHLRQSLNVAAAEPEVRSPVRSRKASRWRRGRSLMRETAQRRSRVQILQRAYEDIADGLGDVEAYIALQSDKRHPVTTAAIAERLLRAGRPEDALAILDGAHGGLNVIQPDEWQVARLKVLEALGRESDAQMFRLQVFHQSLNPDYLRAHLKRLPDFDDLEAEDIALDRVEKAKDFHAAIAFLISWPSLDRAAQTLITRKSEIDGNRHELLALAAEKLDARYPLAATILLRKMIEVILTGFQTHEYERAAGYYSDIVRLAARLDGAPDIEPHESYVAALRSNHRQKNAFWSQVS